MSQEDQVTGSILLMDDEEPILDVMEKLLIRKGFAVSTVRDGNEAVSMYKRSFESGKRFDVVVMDLTIPGGMGGKEAIQELKALDPNVVAVASSGFSNDPIMSDPAAYGFSAILPKPYNIRDLIELVRSLILKNRKE
jgi:CheY-like chemotaxis protein